jgi:hypothetical protein
MSRYSISRCPALMASPPRPSSPFRYPLVGSLFYDLRADRLPAPSDGGRSIRLRRKRRSRRGSRRRHPQGYGRGAGHRPDACRLHPGRRAKLYLSEGTVRNYVSTAIAKTAARNRTEALRLLCPLAEKATRNQFR